MSELLIMQSFSNKINQFAPLLFLLSQASSKNLMDFYHTLLVTR